MCKKHNGAKSKQKSKSTEQNVQCFKSVKRLKP